MSMWKFNNWTMTTAEKLAHHADLMTFYGVGSSEEDAYFRHEAPWDTEFRELAMVARNIKKLDQKKQKEQKKGKNMNKFTVSTKKWALLSVGAGQTAMMANGKYAKKKVVRTDHGMFLVMGTGEIVTAEEMCSGKISVNDLKVMPASGEVISPEAMEIGALYQVKKTDTNNLQGHYILVINEHSECGEYFDLNTQEIIDSDDEDRLRVCNPGFTITLTVQGDGTPVKNEEDEDD